MHSMKKPPSLRRPHAVFGLTTILLVVATLVGFATPAHARDGVRESTPIVAGTLIQTQLGSCTVGAVLKKNTAGAHASTVTAAVRYLVLAKHCAPRINDPVGLDGHQIGVVSWVSAKDDVELVLVPPEVTSSRGCYGQHGCFQGNMVAPRAVGRVILSTRGGERAVPMKPAAIPGADERFCTSGGKSGVNCNWMLDSDRPGNWGDNSGTMAVTTGGRGVVEGDSGGPVVGEQGQLYGILQRAGNPPYTSLMQYLPIDELFSQLDHDYDIAPL